MLLELCLLRLSHLGGGKRVGWSGRQSTRRQQQLVRECASRAQSIAQWQQREEGLARERAIAKFDTDGDGQLSPEERQAARTSISQQRRAAQAAQSGPQYAGAATGYGSNGYPGNSYMNNSYGNGGGAGYGMTGMSGGGSGGGGCMSGSGGSSMAGMGGGGMGMGGMAMGRGHR